MTEKKKTYTFSIFLLFSPVAGATEGHPSNRREVKENIKWELLFLLCRLAPKRGQAGHKLSFLWHKFTILVPRRESWNHIVTICALERKFMPVLDFNPAQKIFGLSTCAGPSHIADHGSTDIYLYLYI